MTLDRRLLLEFLPGIVFLLVNALWGLVPATMAALGGAGVAVWMRYRIDRQMPYLAIATVVLSTVLLTIGMALDDEQFIKIRPTIGGIAFAMMFFIGSAFRPGLLERSLGHKLIMIPLGWRMLQLAWGCLALILAVTNELVWRNTSTDLWVAYRTALDPVALALYWCVTWAVSWYYWDEDEEDED